MSPAPWSCTSWTALCPVGAYLSFDIKRLIDLDTSFAMGRNQLPA